MNRIPIYLFMVLFPFFLDAGGITLYEIANPQVRLASAGWSSRANDPSTVFTNPAGMTRFQCPQIQLGLEAIYAHVEFDPNSNTTVPGNNGYSNQWLPAGSFFYIQPINEKLSVGIGNLGYFGSSLRYNNNWVGKYYLTYNFLEGFSFVPAAAYKITDNLSVGLGVNVMYGIYRLKSAINNSLDSLPDGRLRLIDEDFAAGAVVGLLYEFSPCTRAGLQYLSRVNLRFNATPKFHGVGPRLESLLDRAGILDSKVKIASNVPQSVMISGYHDLNDCWSFMADIGWQQWSRFAEASISLGDPNIPTLSFIPKYDNTWHAAIGAEYRYDSFWTLSGGIAYDSSAVSNKNRTLNFPVGKQWRFGTGACWKYSDNLSVDFCYEFLWSGNLPVDVNRGPLAGRVDGKFSDLYFQFLSLDLNWTF